MDQRSLQIVLKLQDQATAELRKLSGELNGVQASSNKAMGALKNLGGMLATATKWAGAAAAAFGAFGVKVGLETAAQLETAEVGLTTLLGSAEEAAETIARLKVEAARTPFELPGLTQATQLLTSVTKDGDKSIDILLDVGEGLAAMGKGQAELDRIIVNLQQIAAVGKAATIDIKQFAFAGIPIYEMLTETTGKSGEALEELISSGGVTFELLTQMFDEANDEGGRFFNAFVNQSGTFNQALSNMKDSFAIFFADFVQNTGLFQGITDLMMRGSEILGNYQHYLDLAREKVSAFFLELDMKTGLVTFFMDAVKNVGFYFEERFIPAWNDLMAALEPLRPFLDALITVFGTMLVIAIGSTITIVAGLATGFIELLTWATKLGEFISKYLTWYINSLADAINDVIGFVETLIDRFRDAIELAKELGGGAVGKVKGFVGSIADKILPGRAGGGSVMAGSPYVVGEQGPEMFIPRSAGTIVPNGMMAGGGGVNIVVYGDVTGEEIIEKVKTAISSEIKRRIRTS